MSRYLRAPWWMYVIVIGGLNVARQIVFPPSQVGAAATVGLFFAVLAVSLVVIAGLHLLVAPHDRE